MQATLILENGTMFRGVSIGDTSDCIFEAVFNTSMTGYQEVLTNPCFAGQGVVMSYPLIGNYGVNEENIESTKTWASAVIVRSIAERGSNFRCQGSLNDYLKQHHITGIQGVDTRALTRVLRNQGTMNGMITCAENFCITTCLEKIKAHKAQGLVQAVTRKASEVLPALGEQSFRVAVLDCGAVDSLLTGLRQRGCEVTVFPAATEAEAIEQGSFDGVVLSGGPGDPAENGEIVAQVKKLYEGKLPLAGVGLGHQLLALAAGGKTEKLPYGHRGSNHPVKELESGRCYITTQSHSYVVAEDSLPAEVAQVSYRNVNDGTVEGLCYARPDCMSIQFYPESQSGRSHSTSFFDRCLTMMKEGKHNA